MFVSIRDEVVMTTGFDSLHEALSYFDLRAVEMVVGKDYSVRSFQPTPDKPKLFLNSDADVETLGKQIKGSGITITGFLIHNDFNAPDMGKELDWVTRIVEVAEKLHVNAIRIDAIMGGGDSIPVEKREEMTTAAIKTVLERTPRSRVVLGIENHGLQGNDPVFLNAIIQRVKSRRLGMTLDVGNFYWSGKPISEVYRILEQLAPFAKHTHIKNINYPADMRDKQRPLGYEYSKYVCSIPEGDLDMKLIVGFLKKAKYSQDLCIEDESLGKFEIPVRRQHVKDAINLLRQAIG